MLNHSRMTMRETFRLADTLAGLSPDRRADIAARIAAAVKADRFDRFAADCRFAAYRATVRQSTRMLRPDEPTEPCNPLPVR